LRGNRWLIASAAGLSGCLGLELVGPAPNVEPQMSINVQISHLDETSYQVFANFFPGSDEQGEPRATDAVLLVNGEAMHGAPAGAGTLSFEWEQPAKPRLNGAEGLHLIIPASEPPDPGPAIDIPILFTPDPLDLEVRQGDDVVLHVASQLGAPVFTTSLSSWTLEIGESCSSNNSQSTRIQGRGALPSELRVPWTWIESLVSPIDACLHAFSGHQATATPYTVHVFSAATLSWRITVRP
jgi:hypothetical protein